MTIDEFLTTRKLTQAWLARQLGVSEMTISRYARGEIVIPAERAVEIEDATDGWVPRNELRPDLWPKPVVNKRRRQ